MGYSLAPHDSESITDVEIAFATDRLLPAWDEIPSDFKRGNDYTRLVEAIFFNRPLPDGEMDFREGFTQEAIIRVVRAHLRSWAPKHEHKIAGVGYMLSLMATLHPATSATTDV